MPESKPKNESYYTRELCKALERVGCKVDAIVGSRMNKKGRPDRYICHLDWHGWLEAKLNDKPLDPYQIDWHVHQTRRQPGSAFVVRYYPAKDNLDVCYLSENLLRDWPKERFCLSWVLQEPEHTRKFIKCLVETRDQLLSQYSDGKA